MPNQVTTFAVSPKVITIDPVSRVEGHLSIDVTVDLVNNVQQVVSARSSGTLFRGFEQILTGRAPWDAVPLTQRICGVCPVSHGMSASLALEAAANITAPDNGRIMRNLVLGANYIQSHILHFYHLALLDFVEGPQLAPWEPHWSTDLRASSTVNSAIQTKLVNNYLTALDMRRQAHEMGAILAGKLPHVASFVPGGITATPTSAQLTKFNQYLTGLLTFIQNVYRPDVETIANLYPEYAHLGRGPGNLLAHGVFDLNATGTSKLLARGVVANGSTTVQPLNLNSITESVTYSWYNNANNNLNPANGVTNPVFPKTGAYSWMKAPRYQAAPCEAGPLARMWINGDYRVGISVIDRHRARAAEAYKVGSAMLTWLSQINANAAFNNGAATITNGTGIGLTEAPRGAIGHWVKIAGGTISTYQIMTPTCWNASPRDSNSVPGPIEQALVGTPVQNVNEPIEVLRVIHSFDPCLACSVHVARPGKDSKPVYLGR